MGESAIQLQGNIKKVGTHHTSSKGAPEFGEEVYVDFMPVIPGTKTGPILLGLEYTLSAHTESLNRLKEKL